MGIAETINDNLKAAMKSGDKVTLEVLRMLKSELKYKQIELGRDLDNGDYIDVIASAAKKRREAMSEYARGGRDDLAAKEKAELDIINKYLPQQLTDMELGEIIDEVIREVDASTPSDIGKVMKAVMPKIKGKADGRKVNEIVGKKLTG